MCFKHETNDDTHTVTTQTSRAFTHILPADRKHTIVSLIKAVNPKASHSLARCPRSWCIQDQVFRHATHVSSALTGSSDASSMVSASLFHGTCGAR